MSMILGGNDFYEDGCSSCPHRIDRSIEKSIRIAELEKIISLLESEYIDAKSQLYWKSRKFEDYISCCNAARNDLHKIMDNEGSS